MNTNELAAQIREMMYFGKGRVFKHRCTHCINPHDMMFLKAIIQLSNQSKGMVKMSDVSNYFNISAPAMTQQVRRFEKMNFIERVQQEHDRRSVYLRLTAHALEKINETEAVLNQDLIDFITYLGEEDSKELIRIMKKASQFLMENK